MPVPYGGQHALLGRRSVSNSHSSSPKKMDNSSFSSHHSRVSTPHSPRTAASHSLPTPQQAHALKLDEITRRVREQSDRFQRALMPVAEQLRDFADTNPVLFTFLATFTLLSAIPILIFVGFVLVLSFCIISTAVFLACASITGVILFGLAILLPILGATLAISGLLLVFLLGVFLAFRLLHHILEQTQDAAAIDGILSGMRAWIDETKVRVGLLPPPPSSTHESGVSLEGKPFLWEAGDTPRGFGFPQAAGFPSHSDDDVPVKTEKAEDSDWVSDADADAEAPVQSTPRALAPGTLAPANSSPLRPQSQSQPQSQAQTQPTPPQPKSESQSPPQPPASAPQPQAAR